MLLVLLMLITAPQTQPIEWASPAQHAAFTYGPYPQCASGGWGSGKTYEGCLKALYLSDLYPRNRGVIARSVAKELRATTMATFFKICRASAYDPRYGGRRNDQEGYVKLAGSGSEILFLHFEDPDVQGIIRGLEINWFLIDQAEEDPEHMETIFDMLLGRLSRWDVAEVPQRVLDAHGGPWPFENPRTKKPMPPPYAMLACNPDTELHWIYRRFHPESPDHRLKHLPALGEDDQPTGELLSYQDLGYKLFEIHTGENQFLPASNKQALLAHDDAFVQRNYFGKWGSSEGAIHRIGPESIIEGDVELLDYFRHACTLHRFLDHGDTSPTCCLWLAVDKDGNLFWYREYYQPNALISTHRANITALSENERYELNQADPSIFFKEMQKHGGRWSVADEYSDCREHPRTTALFWSAADNNELGTRNRINEYLRVDPERIHPVTKQRGSPRMFFVKANERYPQGCFHVISQTRSQRRVKLGTELGKGVYSDERDEDVTDHAYDPLRYGVASRSPRAKVEQPASDPSTFLGARQQLKQFQKMQQGVRK